MRVWDLETERCVARCITPSRRACITSLVRLDAAAELCARMLACIRLCMRGCGTKALPGARVWCWVPDQCVAGQLRRPGGRWLQRWRHPHPRPSGALPCGLLRHRHARSCARAHDALPAARGAPFHASRAQELAGASGDAAFGVRPSRVLGLDLRLHQVLGPAARRRCAHHQGAPGRDAGVGCARLCTSHGQVGGCAQLGWCEAALSHIAFVPCSGSKGQHIRLWSTTTGEAMGTLRYHQGFLGQRIGPVSCLSFHRHKMFLGIGATDSIVSIYTGHS